MSAGETLINRDGGGEGTNKVQGLEKIKKLASGGRGGQVYLAHQSNLILPFNLFCKLIPLCNSM